MVSSRRLSMIERRPRAPVFRSIALRAMAASASSAKVSSMLSPPEAKETRYLELLRLSYPIHPELFDRLSKDWASLDKFQRTRGVLRMMANVVGVLWHQQVRDPLITPARVPIANERVRASVLYPLDPAFGAVVDKEVDGDSSLPARLEANPTRRISQARAATRAARAVFLCSAPLVGQPNAGLTSQGLRLACAEPGDQLAIFGEAPSGTGRAGDLPLRGSGPLLVLNAADLEPARR
jgi:predicted AAA+ superfamily ATPase